MSAEHSPWNWDGTVWDYDKEQEAPWLVDANNNANEVLTGEIQCKYESNAAFIVRACNAHDELLALARQYASECAECDGEGTFDAEMGFEEVCEACADIRKIIAKAVKP